MRIVILLAAFVVTTACVAVNPQPFKGPNGKPAYSMKCSGMGRTLDECYQKAGEVCPDGYHIIDRASGIVALPVQGGIMAAPQHHMAIECK